MKIISQQNGQRKRESGLTLVEMMVATTLLVVMMLGLTAMFNQTQRAFRSGLKQVDVFEGGRAVMDLVTRDIEQMVASQSTNHWSVFAGLPPFATSLVNLHNDLNNPPLRTNFLYQTFFLNHSTDWSAIGYRVLDPNAVDKTGLTYGSLYRFSTNFAELNNGIPNEHFNTFTQKSSKLTNYPSLTRVADGVVHFRLQFYDANGKLIPPRDENGNIIPNASTNIAEVSWPPILEILPNEPGVIFTNAVPAMVEVELGILEPRTLEQARSVADPVLYLEKQGGKIHIFRQQVQIRNAVRNAQK